MPLPTYRRLLASLCTLQKTSRVRTCICGLDTYGIKSSVAVWHTSFHLVHSIRIRFVSDVFSPRFVDFYTSSFFFIASIIASFHRAWLKRGKRVIFFLFLLNNPIEIEKFENCKNSAERERFDIFLADKNLSFTIYRQWNQKLEPNTFFFLFSTRSALSLGS